MASNLTQYDLLISCPSDVVSEVSIIHEVVNIFNDQYSDVLGISIRAKHWKKDSFPQSGGKPQDLLNEQLVKNCDAAVAIFWTRFGSPTDNYSSGTEEEIEIMRSSGKQVFMYFSNKPVPPSDLDSVGYKRVSDFKEKYTGTGIYSLYSSDEEFKKHFLAHLSQYFLSKQKLDAQKRGPELTIKSIYNRKLNDIAKITGFQFGGLKNKDQMVEEVLELYKEISSIHVSVPVPTPTTNLSPPYSNIQDVFKGIYKPVELEERRKSLIKNAAKVFDISLPDYFFDLGGLRENTLTSSLIMGGGRVFSGSKESENKYKKIINLERLLNITMGWIPFIQIFAGIPCLHLAIANEGTSMDEDVDVTLFLSNESYKHYADFPLPDYNSMEFVSDRIISSSLFEIQSTADYKNYLSTVSRESNEPTDPMPYLHRDYEEDYRTALDEAFDYEYFWEDDQVKIKVHFDYVKQHTAIAFPTPIFISDDIGDIHYTIISRNSPDIIHGELEVEK